MSIIMNAKTDDLIIRFLLGELSKEEQAQVEERFLADNEFFEEVLAAEDTLLDQYLLGRLSDEQRKRAETLFHSSPRQRREVEFTREMIAALREIGAQDHQTTSTAPPVTFAEPTNKLEGEEETLLTHSTLEKSSHTISFIPAALIKRMPRVVWIAVSLICFSFLAWVAYLYTQKRNPEAQSVVVERGNQDAREKPSAENENKTEDDRQLEIEKEKRGRADELIAQARPRKPDKVTSILLAPTTTDRGGGSQTLTLKADTRRIQLQLELDESPLYSQYNVEINTFDGRKVWSKKSLDAGQIKQGRLSLVLSSSLLEYEDYKIELKGLSDTGTFVHVADYIFKVRQ